MQAVVTALTTQLDAGALWGALTPLVPLIGVVTLFSLGLFFFRRAVKKLGKGKAGF